MVKLDKPLVKEKFEAWQFGPMLQYVYTWLSVVALRELTIERSGALLSRKCGEAAPIVGGR